MPVGATAVGFLVAFGIRWIVIKGAESGRPVVGEATEAGAKGEKGASRPKTHNVMEQVKTLGTCHTAHAWICSKLMGY